MCSPTKLFEGLEYENDVPRALARHQFLRRQLGVVFSVDDDDQRQLVPVPARKVRTEDYKQRKGENKCRPLG